MKTYTHRLITATWILVMCALLVSCHHSFKRNIISENKFVDLLVDIHLADAIASEKGYIDQTYQIDSASLYGSVFRKHRVTKAEFDSTMVYYSSRPDDFQKVYNRVTAELKERQEKINTENRHNKTSEILWQNDQVFRYPPMTDNKIDIDVPVSGPGTYTITALVKVYPDDETVNPRMSVYFYTRDPDILGKRIYFDEIKYLNKNGLPKVYSATKKITDPEITNIRGRILEFNDPGHNVKHHIEVSDIRVTMEN
jgi:hypothetical protein